MLALIANLLAGILSLAAPDLPRRTTATRYADTARDEGGTPSCWRRCLRAAPDGSCAQRFPDELFDAEHPLRVAHRDLPCGTAVLVRSPAGRVALGFVLDRGPWGRAECPRMRRSGPLGRSRPLPGALVSTRSGSPRSARPGRPCYRGDLDLSPRVADALGLTLRVGRMPVRWTPLP